MNPKDALAYINRGIAYHEMNEFQLAIENFDQAIPIEPKDADSYYNRGLLAGLYPFEH